MSNPSKAKGTAAETAIVRYLRANGFGGADRQPLRGNRDQGDIALCPGIIIEAKTSKRTGPTGLPPEQLLTTWLDQTELERANAGAAIGLLVVKRHGTTNPGRWHTWWRLEHLADVLAEDGHADIVWSSPVMLDLANTVELLRQSGYGDAPVDSPAARTPVEDRVELDAASGYGLGSDVRSGGRAQEGVA